MNILLVEKERKNWMTIYLKMKGKVYEYFISERQKTELAQNTILAMDAFLVTVSHLYQVNGKTVPPGESQVIIRQRLGIPMKQRTPGTAAEPYLLSMCTIPFNKREAK